MVPKFDQLLPVLVNAGVELILIGGVAGVIHGSARVTYDVDMSIAGGWRIWNALLPRWRALALTCAMCHPACPSGGICGPCSEV